MQTIIHHQLLSQQQADQAQKKPRSFGVLRRAKQPSPVQSPVLSRASSPAPRSPSTPVAQRWKDRLRRGRSGQTTSSVYNQSASPTPLDSPVISKEDNFQTVSLDWALLSIYIIGYITFQKKHWRGQLMLISVESVVTFIYRLFLWFTLNWWNSQKRHWASQTNSFVVNYVYFV